MASADQVDYVNAGISPLVVMRTSLVAGLVVAGLLAGMDPARTAPLPDSGQASDASLTLSAEKATTYQIATTAINFAVFLAGTGSAVDGGILTVYNTAKSWVVYTLNDYAWDAYFPAGEANASGTPFDARRSFWRTTGKVLTYRPIDTALKFV